MTNNQVGSQPSKKGSQEPRRNSTEAGRSEKSEKMGRDSQQPNRKGPAR